MMIPAQTVTANGNVILSDTGQDTVGRWIVSVVKTGGTFTVKPQKRVHPADNVTGHAFADCWYTLALSNTATTAGTTQTTDCILDIDASGCDVQLVFTVAGGASLSVHAVPVAG